MLRMKNTWRQRAAYATGGDFCRIFAENMNDLYVLALLLTADPAKAEQCFVAGFDDCSTGNRVFKEWAQAWARRVITKNAIRLINPAPDPGGDASNAGRNLPGNREWPQLRAEMSLLLGLPDFARFVFVMSVLEGYSDRDCALLLGCSRENLLAGRVYALQQIARSREADSKADGGALAKPVPNDGNSVVELVAPARLATPA